MFVGGNYTVDPTFSSKRLSSAQTTGIFDLSEVSEAAAEDAFIHSPTRSLFDIAESNNLAGEDEGATLSKDDIKLKADKEFYAKYMTVPDEGMTEREYNILYEDIRSQKLREYAFQRAPDTFGQFVSTLGVSLGVSMLDPTSIALGYLPIAAARAGFVGANAARFAKNYDTTLDTLEAGGRAMQRAKLGAASGLFEGVVAEVPVYIAANNRGEKYGATDVFNSVMFGAVVGTGIHVGGGVLYDAATVSARASTRRKIAIDKEFEADRVLQEQLSVGPFPQSKAELDKQIKAQTSIGPRSLEELESTLLESFLKGGINSKVQRDLASYSIEDRAALMQAGLAQFTQGKNILGTDFVKTFEARRLGERYRPEDVDQVRNEVVLEFLQSEQDLKGITGMNGGIRESFTDNIKGIKNEISVIEGKIVKLEKQGTSNASRVKAQAKVTQSIKELEAIKEAVDIGIKKGASKNKRAEYQSTLDLYEKKKIDLRDLKRNFETDLKNEKMLDLELARSELEISKQLLDDHRGGFKTRENYAKRIRDRTKSLLTGKDIPTDTFSKINAEIRRRMNIIDEIHLPQKPRYQFGAVTKTASTVKKYMNDLKTKTEAPSAQRSFRAEAEANMEVSGRRVNSTEETTVVAQEAVDAIENAVKMADDVNVKYEPSKLVDETLTEIKAYKTAAEKLAVCMSKPL